MKAFTLPPQILNSFSVNKSIFFRLCDRKYHTINLWTEKKIYPNSLWRTFREISRDATEFACNIEGSRYVRPERQGTWKKTADKCIIRAEQAMEEQVIWYLYDGITNANRWDDGAEVGDRAIYIKTWRYLRLMGFIPGDHFFRKNFVAIYRTFEDREPGFEHVPDKYFNGKDPFKVQPKGGVK